MISDDLGSMNIFFVSSLKGHDIFLLKPCLDWRTKTVNQVRLHTTKTKQSKQTKSISVARWDFQKQTYH